MTAAGIGWLIGFFVILIIIFMALGSNLGWFSSFTNRSVFVNKIS